MRTRNWSNSKSPALDRFTILLSTGIVLFFISSATACSIAPKYLSARAAFATEIYLGWRNYSLDPANLSVMRSTDNKIFSKIASLPPSYGGYTDKNVKPLMTYYYRVLCSNAKATNVAVARTTVALNNNPNAVYAEPTVSKPGYLASYVDPVFHTRVTRISNNPGLSFVTANFSKGVWSRDSRHTYQLVQPWSADGSRYMLENKNDGGGVNASYFDSWLYLSGTNYRPELGPLSNQPAHGPDERWNPSPQYATQLIMAGDSSPRLWWFDVAKNVTSRTWNLPFIPRWIGNTKGDISFDGRYVALIDTTLSKMVIVDMDPKPPFAPYPNQRIGPVYTIEKNVSGATYTDPTVSVDPTGRYAVIHYSYRNGSGGNFMRVYDINPNTLALSVRKMPASRTQCVGSASDNWIYSLGHHDLAYNPFDKNEPVAVGQEECDNVRRNIAGVKAVNGNGIGHVVMVRLRDGAVTSLTDPGNGSSVPYEAYAHHVSAQNRNLPGWIFVSYGPWPGQQSYRYYDEIIALSLDGKQRVQRLAHMHSDYDNITGANCSRSDSDFDYRSESHAVASPSGKQIAFASNWLVKGAGTGGCSIQDFVVNLTAP